MLKCLGVSRHHHTALRGNANVTLIDPIGISLGAPSYSKETNTLTQSIIFAKGGYPKVQNLLALSFTDTRATPGSDAGSGFSELKIYRPGYAPELQDEAPPQLFTDNMMALLKIFDHTRWMGTTGQESYNFRCGPPNAGACSAVAWDERIIPDRAFQSPTWCTGECGAITPWEHVLLAANEIGSDVWINVPITATSPSGETWIAVHCRLCMIVWSDAR
eukprot:COSAG02_NODE_419_length_22613_cov_22.994492_12_plen_218_part_00